LEFWIEIPGVTEVREIKNLLLEICKKKGVEEESAAVSTAAATATIGQHGPDLAGPSHQVRTDVGTTGGLFSVETNTINPTGPGNQGNVFGEKVVNTNQISGQLLTTTQTFTRPFPTVLPQSNAMFSTPFSQTFQTAPFLDGFRETFPNNSPHRNANGANVNRPFGFARIHMVDNQKNGFVGGNHYAEAVIKGPRLEISLFEGDDPIEWLKQCEKFYEIFGTRGDQWVNLAVAHLQGRAAKWFRGVGIPWQLITWPQWCAIVCTRFSVANVHEAAELFQNVKQYGLSVDQYIDKFEDCVELVRRDHPYLQEQYLTSCFIGGLRGDIKHDVCGQKPQGLLETYWYAKNYEKAAHARRGVGIAARNINFINNATNQGRNQVNRGAQARVNGEKKDEKKCWFYKEPWFPRHQCKVKQALHALIMEGDEMEEDEGEETEGEAQEEEELKQQEELQQGEPGKLMCISLNAVQ
jgi:hypothetical protein